MTVYVDPLMATPQSRTWPWHEACHMYADTRLELIQTAKDLGLKERWFQEHRLLPHFDLTAGKRAQAIKNLGVQKHTEEEMMEKAKEPAFKKEWNLETLGGLNESP